MSCLPLMYAKLSFVRLVYLDRYDDMIARLRYVGSAEL